MVSETENRRGFPMHYLFEGGVIVLVVLALWAMATPVVLKSAKKSAESEAMSNAKQLHYLLREFEEDYGMYPCDETAKNNLVEYGTADGSSNDYLGQLFEGGYTRSEEIFYAKGGSESAGKPDNVIMQSGGGIDRDELLKAGECGFAYMKGLNSRMHSKLPVLMTPMREGGRVEYDVHAGKCVVLFLDGSVNLLDVDRKTERAVLEGGSTLFCAGEGTPWGDIVEPLGRVAYPR